MATNVAVSFLVLSVLYGGQAIAHGGGLDKFGCHNDRKSGGYHCHRAPTTAPNSSKSNDNLNRCKTITDPQKRLACFDGSTR